MNNSDGSSIPPRYSPFGALLAVFAALIFLQLAYLRDGMREREQIMAAREQLKPALTKARALAGTAEALGRDLLTLSSNNVEAASIVREFNIQLSQPLSQVTPSQPK